MSRVDPRDFLLNTDYEMDKIILIKDIQETTSSVKTLTIPHGLSTVPLLFGVWATNKDYINAHELGDYDDPWNPYLRCIARSDLTNIYLDLTPNYDGNNYVSTTFYVRVFGFEPKDNHLVSGRTTKTITGRTLATTAKNAQTFILNTDYNYLKLLKGGSPLTWDSSRSCSVYTHNLKYVPQVMLWWTFGWNESGTNIEFGDVDSWSYSAPSSPIQYNSGFFVDDTEIRYFSGIVPLQSEVRIYADEA